MKPSPLADSLHHIALKCSCLDKMKSFYGQLLGLDLIEEQEKNGLPYSLWYQLDSCILMIEISPEYQTKKSADFISPVQNSSLAVITFKINMNERQYWTELLKKQDIKILKESDYTLYFCDPAGNPLGLSHYPDKVLP